MDTSQQAQRNLRLEASDAAWWLRHAATVMRTHGELALAGNLEDKAKRLADMVKDANDALDREAFGA